MNTKKAKKGKVNFLYKLLSAVFIWIGIIAVGVFWSWVFGGEQFLLTSLLLFPFTIIGIYSTRAVWQYYK